MKTISLFPADQYTVVNKTIITEEDKNNLFSLYAPIIGPLAISLYFIFLRDLHRSSIISVDYTHHHLMTMMKSSIDNIKDAREALEGVGLLKTYVKEGDTNCYVYELYSPLSPKEFFSSPIFNITLYNNIGKNEYNLLASEYEFPKIDLKDYTEISKELNKVFKPSSIIETFNAKEKRSGNINLESSIDFELLISSMPKGIIKPNALTKKMKQLINELSFIYDLDTLKMVELLRSVITERGTFDKESLRKSARKYYQYNSNGKLPTLVYRTQPEYLKTPEGQNNPLAQITYLFENTTPYDFLKIKYKGANPTSRDLQLLEMLLIDLELSPGVVNVLVDYVLKKNNNKLTKAYIETIASQWKRSGIETVKEAMEFARNENNKLQKKNKNQSKINNNTNKKEPVWFNEKIEKEEMNEEEIRELEEMFKEYR